MMKERPHVSHAIQTRLNTTLNYLFLLLLLLFLAACGGGGSGGDESGPQIDALIPSTVTVGSGETAVTVNGSGFVAGSVVRINVAAAAGGAALPMGAKELTTTVESDTQLTVTLEAIDLMAAGTATLTVLNPEPDGGESGAATLTIVNPLPVITGLGPNSAQAGGPAFTLFVNGTGFVDGSVINWGGSARATSFIASGQLSAEISAGEIASIADIEITVTTPASLGPGGGTSNPQTFQVSALPQPQIVALSPIGAPVGSGAFTLTVDGNNFQSDSEVRWNGSSRATTFVSIGQLTAQINAGDVASIGANDVTVFSPGVGGAGDGESDPVIFNVSPLPTTNNLAPDNRLAGSGAFTLTVNGANFLTGATVLWGGSARTTTFVSAGQLTAAIAAADIATAGDVTVTVMNPDNGLSNAQVFTVNPLPSIANVMPNNVDVGGGDFTLTVNGANFLNGAIVRWNGANRTTTFQSDTLLEADILAADIANLGTAMVSVLNPDGGVSGNATVTIDNPVPTANALSPSSAAPGGPGFTLTVMGSGFVNGAVVRWNGADRTTMVVDSNTVTASILMSDIASEGDALVTVFNPAPGGGVSNARTFVVSNTPVPVINTLSPDDESVGASFTLTVTGSGFDPTSVVRWGFASVDLPTTFVSSTELDATVTSNETAEAGCVPVEVFTPGGGTSNLATFTVGAGTCSPIPVIDDLQPRSATVGDGSFTLDVVGSGFSTNSVVRWDGTDLTTNFVSDTLLEADVSSAALAAVDNVAITVETPSSPAAVSQPDTFFVLDAGQTVFYDNFNRPDNEDIGNSWVEKTPSIFSLNGGEITGIDSTGSNIVFDNNITYRPDIDTLDVEVSMEFTVTSAVGDRPTYPQVHARIDLSDVAQPEQLSSYTLFYDKDAASMVVTPISNRQECYLSLWPIPGGILDTGERYRMRFIVTGTDPVMLRGILDEFVNGAWQVLVDQTVPHDDNTQPLNDPDAFCNTPGGQMLPPVTVGGTAGFAKWTRASERLDNFYTIPLP